MHKQKPTFVLALIRLLLYALQTLGDGCLGGLGSQTTLHSLQPRVSRLKVASLALVQFKTGSFWQVYNCYNHFGSFMEILFGVSHVGMDSRSSQGFKRPHKYGQLIMQDL